MNPFTFLALACATAALSSSAAAQLGIYTDTVCSCSLFTDTATGADGNCLRMISDGICERDQCAPGYRCDLA